jgi:hypothetical protein
LADSPTNGTVSYRVGLVEADLREIRSELATLPRLEERLAVVQRDLKGLRAEIHEREAGSKADRVAIFIAGLGLLGSFATAIAIFSGAVLG